jgi:5'-nucleotidase
MKKTIGIDLDSCLNDLETQWILTQYNKEYNDNVKLEDMVRWDVTTYIKPECGKKIYEFLLRPNFFLNLNPKEYSQMITKKLSEKYDIYVITAYTPSTVVDKVEWIKKYFPHIDTDKVIFCNYKGIIKTDFLIDDGSHNILDYYNNGGKNPIVYDRPWNRDLLDKFMRAYDWCDVGAILL